MATSSITKNFVISGKEQVEMFVNAIEESAKNRPVHIPVAEREISGMFFEKKCNRIHEKEPVCYISCSFSKGA